MNSAKGSFGASNMEQRKYDLRSNYNPLTFCNFSVQRVCCTK